MPRRGSAQDSGRRDGGSPDRRQVEGRRLGESPRRQPVAVRECLDLGTHAHRPHHPPRRERRFGAAGSDLARRRPHGRAGRAHGNAPGDAHHGPPVRDGAHDRRSARQFAHRRQPSLSIHVRHARRGGARPAPTPIATSTPTLAPSVRCRAAPASTPTPSRGRASRSSSPRCIRSSSVRIAVACWGNSRRDWSSCASARATPGWRSPSMRRSPSVSSSRSNFSRRSAGRRASPDGPVSASLSRPTRSARRRHCGISSASPRETSRVLHVRLVKGAYWDAEIKRGQERGMAGYPVFTRKPNTDVSYLACAQVDPGAGRGPPLPAVRHAQRAHGGGRVAHGQAPRAGIRVPAPARHGRGPVRRGHEGGRARRAVPRLCARGRARGPASVPRPAAARERREHVVRQPDRQ